MINIFPSLKKWDWNSLKKSQSKISHHEILFIRKFRGNIGKIKNYDYEKKITKTSKSNKYLWTYGEHMKIRYNKFISSKLFRKLKNIIIQIF